jgi:hypothetical protein
LSAFATDASEARAGAEVHARERTGRCPRGLPLQQRVGPAQLAVLPLQRDRTGEWPDTGVGQCRLPLDAVEHSHDVEAVTRDGATTDRARPRDRSRRGQSLRPAMGRFGVDASSAPVEHAGRSRMTMYMSRTTSPRRFSLLRCWKPSLRELDGGHGAVGQESAPETVVGPVAVTAPTRPALRRPPGPSAGSAASGRRPPRRGRRSRRSAWRAPS